jgi:hypothetical protein
MALTNAERSRRYREKKKNAGLGEVMKKKDRLRKKLARAKMSPRDLGILRLRQIENKKNFRSKGKKQPPVAAATSSFCTKQTKAKALKKIINVLPANKDKQIELVQHLAQNLGIMKQNKEHERATKAIPLPVQTEVRKFFSRDDVSYQAPGKRDFISIKIDGIKRKLQKRYLFFTLREAYQLYIDENPNIIISRSSFKDLRPPNVLYKSSTPHNVCVCLYHENVSLLLKALNEHVNGFKTISLQSFVKLLVCDDGNEKCMSTECDKCNGRFNGKVQQQIIDEKYVIEWTLWTTSVEGRAVKTDFSGTVLECCTILHGKIKHFLMHVFIKRQQASYFETVKLNVTDKYCLLQVDYSENFSVVQQNEIQSAHWAKKQLALFTAHVWSQSANHSIVIVSDNPSHNKFTVTKCLEHVLTHLQILIPSLVELVIYSDGSASQFKQRYLFKNLTLLAKDFNILLSWHFFATSHGKG